MVIKLIVGLGNIGLKYQETRHNLGAKYVNLLANRYCITLQHNKLLKGYLSQLQLGINIVQLLIPNSYMNTSGDSVFKCIKFYQLYPEEILIAHDELDLLPGQIRIKLGTKTNDTHRGIQNIIFRLNDISNFYRLRIGIGRPKNKNEVSNFILSIPSLHEKKIINYSMHEAIQCIENIVTKDLCRVMNRLHAL